MPTGTLPRSSNAAGRYASHEAHDSPFSEGPEARARGAEVEQSSRQSSFALSVRQCFREFEDKQSIGASTMIFRPMAPALVVVPYLPVLF
jgi:hypothetical protein